MAELKYILPSIWILFFVLNIILSFIIEPKGILDRFSVFFQKQHLLLLFSALIMTGYCFAPLIKIEGVHIQPFSLTSTSPALSNNIGFPVIGNYFVFWCYVGAIVTIVLDFIIIFLHKTRKVQIAFCWLGILSALFCFCYAYYRMTTAEVIEDQTFYYGNISPIVAVLFTFLAMFYIRKDDELVKSVDRLR